MILSTIPDAGLLARFENRAVPRFSCVIRADLDMRGFAISFVTLAYAASPGVFLPFLFGIHTWSHWGKRHAAPFRTVARHIAAAG